MTPKARIAILALAWQPSQSGWPSTRSIQPIQISCLALRTRAQWTGRGRKTSSNVKNGLSKLRPTESRTWNSQLRRLWLRAGSVHLE